MYSYFYHCYNNNYNLHHSYVPFILKCHCDTPEIHPGQLLKCRRRFLNIVLKCEEYVLFKSIFVVCNSTVVIHLLEVELQSYGLWMFNFTKLFQVVFQSGYASLYILASSFVKLYTSASSVYEFWLICVFSNTRYRQTFYYLPVRWHEVMDPCGFNLHCDCQWVWVSFYMFTNLVFPFWNTWLIFYPFYHWVDF